MASEEKSIVQAPAQSSSSLPNGEGANNAAAVRTQPRIDGDSASASAANTSTRGSPMDPTDEVVMSYLRKKGMGSAILELTNILKERNPKQPEPSSLEKMEMDEVVARNQRSILARATGGGFGYDVDGAAAIVQWGVPGGRVESSVESTEGGGSKSSVSLPDRMGTAEATAYIESFAGLITWVLSLPDDPAARTKTRKPTVPKESQKEDACGISIASVVKHSAGSTDVPEAVASSIKALEEDAAAHWLPPSAKPELLAVAFALLVHTYCELLEVGMETRAKSLLDTFRPVYEPLYHHELANLDKCRTTDEIVTLNSQNSIYLESISTLKAIMGQVVNYQGKKKELSMSSSATTSALKTALKKRKVAEYDQNIGLLQQKYDEIKKRATAAFEKTQDFPFLRRARAVRWQLTLSSTSYGMLAAFLSSREFLLPMSTLLQTKCEVQVERRDPLPFTPSCILDDTAPDHNGESQEIRWAAPVTPAARLAEAGEKVDSQSMLKQTELLPFPRFHLEEEYDSRADADVAKRGVEFNRALLMNGFRRMEALERKRDYDSGLRRLPETGTEDETTGPAVANPLEPSVLLSTLCASSSPGAIVAKASSRPGRLDTSAIWEESGVGITCVKMCLPDGRRAAAGCDDSAVRIWSVFDADDTNNDEDEQSNRSSSPEKVTETAMILLGHKNGFPVFDVDWNRDGRTLLSAGGDGSVRLWDTMAKGPYGNVSKKTRGAQSSTANASSDDGIVPGLKKESSGNVSGAALSVYRGHLPSTPVWSVAFAPSGYYFASAGADGTARLWTTDRPAPVRIFTGHTSPSVNCVTWHPNCNYVLTGGDDKTIRMWDVQTGNCIRLLNGCSQGVNAVTVSPSGRYAAGADYSGIVSIWDLGNGRKVNELRPLVEPTAGTKRSSSGKPRHASDPRTIHALCFSACGSSLATGGDDCTVRIWDVRGSGNNMANQEYASKHGWGEGSAVTKMETQLNRQPAGAKNRPGTMAPSKSFSTRRTLIMDLHYTKRNLLLSVGKYAAPLSIVVPYTN